MDPTFKKHWQDRAFYSYYQIKGTKSLKFSILVTKDEGSRTKADDISANTKNLLWQKEHC